MVISEDRDWIEIVIAKLIREQPHEEWQGLKKSLLYLEQLPHTCGLSANESNTEWRSFIVARGESYIWSVLKTGCTLAASGKTEVPRSRISHHWIVILDDEPLQASPRCLPDPHPAPAPLISFLFLNQVKYSLISGYSLCLECPFFRKSHGSLPKLLQACASITAYISWSQPLTSKWNSCPQPFESPYSPLLMFPPHLPHV